MDNNLYFDFRNLKFSADFRFARFPAGFLNENLDMWQKAHKEMAALEKGAIANPDEGAYGWSLLAKKSEHCSH